MALSIYAGTAATDAGLHLLPSPVSIGRTNELIWSENTGRAQEGENIAKMIGTVVGEKRTYEISWGVITQAQMTTIKTYLKKGFFYFGVGQTKSEAISSASSFYRSEIKSSLIEAGGVLYYKDVSVSVIEQ